MSIRHGNRFLDTALRNPLRERIGPFHQLAPLVDFAEQHSRRHEDREALALAIWHAPADIRGRSLHAR